MGFITGAKNFETYGLTNIEFRSGMQMKDMLEQEMDFNVKFSRDENDQDLIELLKKLVEDKFLLLIISDSTAAVIVITTPH